MATVDFKNFTVFNTSSINLDEFKNDINSYITNSAKEYSQLFMNRLSLFKIKINI